MEEDRIFCPACNSPEEHAVVKAGNEQLVRCQGCGTVHSIQVDKSKLASLRVIVSKDASAQVYSIKIPATEELHVGSELLVDDESHDVVLAEITSLETDRREVGAKAGAIKTVWARAIDDVTLKISLFRHGIIRSVKLLVPGQKPFQVGQVGEAKGVRFRVEKIKLREGSFSEAAEAKDILRIWGREL